MNEMVKAYDSLIFQNPLFNNNCAGRYKMIKFDPSGNQLVPETILRKKLAKLKIVA